MGARDDYPREGLDDPLIDQWAEMCDTIDYYRDEVDRLRAERQRLYVIVSDLGEAVGRLERQRSTTTDLATVEAIGHRAAVPMPNSVPTGERFATSTESYACGMPNIPPPQWLKDAKPHD